MSWVPQYLTYLEELVNISSSSRDEEGLKKCANALERITEEILGTKPKVIWIDGRDGVKRAFLEIRLVSPENQPTPQEEASSNGYVLHLGHYDTVEDVTETFRFSRDGDVIRGPGVSDDKGSILADLYALKLLQIYAPIEVQRWVKALFTADEEITSRDGRKVINLHAPSTFSALVLEGLDRDEKSGNFVVRIGRKGYIDYTTTYCEDEFSPVNPDVAFPYAAKMAINYTGVEADSGVDHKNGADANVQALKDVVKISHLHNSNEGISITFEGISGGSAINKVSESAQIILSIEADDPTKLEQVQQLLDSAHSVANVSRNIKFQKLSQPNPISLSRRTLSNAILQACKDGLQIKDFEDANRGISTNIGIIKSNPSKGKLVDLLIEARSFDLHELRMIDNSIKQLPLQMPGITKNFDGGIARSPWKADSGSKGIHQLVKEVHDDYGFPPVESIITPGVSDANLLPAEVAKIDGMGLYGENRHSKKEWASVEDIPWTITRLAETTTRLLTHKPLCQETNLQSDLGQSLVMSPPSASPN